MSAEQGKYKTSNAKNVKCYHHSVLYLIKKIGRVLKSDRENSNKYIFINCY